MFVLILMHFTHGIMETIENLSVMDVRKMFI